MSSQAKQEYNKLKESGDLKLLFPKATGDWDLDKIQFTRLYEENLKFIDDFENNKLIIDDFDLEEDDEY